MESPAAEKVCQLGQVGREGGVLIIPRPRVFESAGQFSRAKRSQMTVEDHEEVEGNPHLGQRGARSWAPRGIRLIAPVPPGGALHVAPCGHGPVQEGLLKVGMDPTAVVEAGAIPVGSIDKCHNRRALGMYGAEEQPVHRGHGRARKGVEPGSELGLEGASLLKVESWADKPAPRALSGRRGAVTDKPPESSCNLFSKIVTGSLTSRRGTKAVDEARQPWADSRSRNDI